MQDDKTYIFDLEGTLSNSRWREYLLPDYDAFHAKFPEDEMKENNCRLFNICSANSKVIILTGMMEKHRHMAVSWLYKNKLVCDRIIMRPNNNLKSSPQFKTEWVREFMFRNGKSSVAMLFEDRADVVQAMLDINVPAIMVF
jgi:hypothetical protein